MSFSELTLGAELARFGADFVICVREPTVAEVAQMDRKHGGRRAKTGSDGVPFRDVNVLRSRSSVIT